MRLLLTLTASALALAGCSYSSHGPADNRSVERAGMVASGDVDATGSAEYAGMIVRASGDIGRDLDLAGASVRSDARVGGNLTAAGARVRFTGSVAGTTDVEAATAYLAGQYDGDVSIVGARLTVEGNVDGALFAQGARIQLAGRFAQPVRVVGDGNRLSGHAIVSGTLESGGTICASEVDIRRSARIHGSLTVIADERPDNLAPDATFEPLSGRRCDRL